MDSTKVICEAIDSSNVLNASVESTETVNGAADTLNVLNSTIESLLNGDTSSILWTDFLSSMQNFAIKLFFSILIYIVAKKIINLLAKSLTILMEKRDVDVSVRAFLAKSVKIALKLIIFVVIIGILGVDTTSLIAVLASAGFAIGLALQGSLQNFAGGIIVLFLKPFKVGDEIETSAGGYRGIVKEIGIFTTNLTTFDNVSIIIPNSDLSTHSLINYTKEEKRRVDEVIGIDYGDSVDTAREILMNIIKEDERVLHSEGVSIVVAELSDSSVNLKVLAWTHKSNYYGVKADLREKAHAQFKEKGITIPFPQLQVHNS
ncbi:MAG: mechanosensitive ion channel [Rikenellaceae bacterium]